MGQSKKQWEDIQQRSYDSQRPQAAKGVNVAAELINLKYYIAKAIEQEKTNLSSFAANTIERGALPALRRILSVEVPPVQSVLPLLEWVSAQIRHNETQVAYWQAHQQCAIEVGDESWANQCGHWIGHYTQQMRRLEKREEQKSLHGKMKAVGFNPGSVPHLVQAYKN